MPETTETETTETETPTETEAETETPFERGARRAREEAARRREARLD
jgi:hypothetical protein